MAAINKSWKPELTALEQSMLQSMDAKDDQSLLSAEAYTDAARPRNIGGADRVDAYALARKISSLSVTPYGWLNGPQPKTQGSDLAHVSLGFDNSSGFSEYRAHTSNLSGSWVAMGGADRNLLNTQNVLTLWLRIL